MKKKVYLLLRISMGIDNDSEKKVLAKLKRQAEEDGYEVVGEQIVIGSSKKMEEFLREFLEGDVAKTIDCIYAPAIRTLSFSYLEAKTMYDIIKEKGVEFETADGNHKWLANPSSLLQNVRLLYDCGEKTSSNTENDEIIPKM